MPDPVTNPVEVPDPTPEVTIPTVEIPSFSGGIIPAIEENTEQAQSALDDRYNTVASDRPEYNSPSDEALDTISNASEYRSPEDTVAGQMADLLGEDSAYMRAVDVRSDEQAQRFGALGSTMHAGASTRSAIEEMLPIAQQDAETASKYNMQQQAAENQLGVIEGEAQISSELMYTRTALENQQKQLNESFQMAMQGMDLEGQAMMSDMQGQWQMVTNDANLRLDAALQQNLANQAIDADTVKMVKESSASLIQNYQISVENLLKDPDFLQLGSETVKNTLNNMLATTTASIRFLGDSSGVNLDIELDMFADEAAFTADVQA